MLVSSPRVEHRDCHFPKLCSFLIEIPHSLFIISATQRKCYFTSSSSPSYLFYTYNHYNDFQEYLNYEGGWGEIFGNITGGGKISSKYDYNPTPYVKVARRDLTVKGQPISAYYFFDESKTESVIASLFAKSAA